MVRQNSSKPVIGCLRKIRTGPQTVNQTFVRWLLLAFAVSVGILPDSRAESPASKNKEGNRLYAEGRYEDAEKAYLQAQGADPGRPEILYNLGNSLIKQKKYDPGIVSLRQSMGKGEKGIRESSWYNTGNALFLAGRLKDSVEAYVQALRLNPSDRDAKHNLELALMKLKEQESSQPDANSKQKDSEKPEKNRPEENRKQTGANGRDDSGNRQTQQGQEKPESAQNTRREGAISREQALRILDALQGRELEEQRRVLERRAKQSTNRRDW